MARSFAEYMNKIGSIICRRVESLSRPDRAGWGLNLHQYATNPLSYIEPLGLCKLSNLAKVIRGGLSTMPTPFSNGRLTETTVGDIRALDDGWDVVPEPKKSNPVYASIIPPNGVTLTSAQAEALSGVFNSNPNQWKPSKK